MMTSNEDFNLESYLKDFGRLTYVRPRDSKSKLVMKAGKTSQGEKAVDVIAKVIYPGDIMTAIFPTKIPEGMLPMMVGPSFSWHGSRWNVAKMILDCDVVYDETECETDDLSDLGWWRLQAAYLVNEIAPGKEITVKEWCVADKQDDSSPVDFLLGLLEDEDPFSFDGFDAKEPFGSEEGDSFDFDTLDSDDDHPGLRLVSRKVSVTDWLAEHMDIARAYFSFYTSSIVIGKGLFEHCTPAEDLSAFLDLIQEKPRKSADKLVKWAKQSLDIYHAHSYRYIADFAESTTHQRMELFDQMIRVESAKHIRATLGDYLIAGNYFGTDSTTIRRTYNSFDFIMVLLLRGFLSVDLERRTFEITEGGWKVIEILRKCPHVSGYEGVIADISAGVAPLSAAKVLEDWIPSFFEALRSELANQDAPKA